VRRIELRGRDVLAPVMPLLPAASRITEATASGNDDGLKMCTRRPSLFQRISSFGGQTDVPPSRTADRTSPAEPQEKIDAENDGKRAKPRVYVSRRDQPSSISNAVREGQLGQLWN